MSARLVRSISCCAIVATAAISPESSRADEGGISFWVPGFFGSLAATPQQPGFAFATIYYHTSVSAGGEVAFARQVSKGPITTNLSGNISANLDADANLALLVPSYTFATPVLGGQAAVALIVPTGRNTASVDATLTGAIGPFGFTRSAGITESASGFGDLAPQASLRWNFGVHNLMTYVTGNIPVGAYKSSRIAKSWDWACCHRLGRRLHLSQSANPS